jgi:HK97 gp10 family phage protein
MTTTRLWAQLENIKNIDAVRALIPAGRALVRVAHEYVPVDTGNLRDGIRVEELPPQENGVMVVAGGNQIIPPNRYRDIVNYACFVEFGTSKMEAQPYMRPAVDMTQGEMSKLIAENINQQLRELAK